MKATACLQRGYRRLALTTKQTNKGYYKGTGTGSMGEHTKFGRYLVDPRKVRTYVCPDLSDFKLTPFVTRKVEPKKGSFYEGEKMTESAMDGMRYINKWVEEGAGQ